MFARLMAEKGFSVAVVDKATPEALGARLSLFHIDEQKFSRYGIKPPQPGDPEYANRFAAGLYRSAFDRYEKKSECPNLLLRFAPFLKRLRTWAEAAGAEFFYQTEFVDFLRSEDGKINGALLRGSQGEQALRARLTADCSGICSVARRRVSGQTLDSSEITARDMFYVSMHFVRLKAPGSFHISAPVHYAQYKSWIGQTDEDGCFILGSASNLSYEYAELCHERFRRAVPLPEMTELRVERGVTPYRQPPYSMVADGFLCIGDSACMTKPFSGEGVTSSWVGCEHAAKAAARAMANGACPSEAALWGYNVSYAKTQGADFAYISAVLANACDSAAEENDYMFAHDIVFSDSALTRVNRHYNYDMPPREAAQLAGRLLAGVAAKKISLNSLKAMLRGMLCATALRAHYRAYPKTPVGFARWKTKAERLWKKTGSIADAIVRTEDDALRLAQKEHTQSA
jgi:electron-transferring-flavoprotein dehydrogenase